MQMNKYDFSGFEELSGGYGPGKHTVIIGKWEFQESPNKSLYLNMRWEKGTAHEDRPFASSRLYFSSKTSAGLSKHTLHLLCDKMGIPYKRELLDNSEKILQLGKQLEGKIIDIELVPTGEKSPKGHNYLGVYIDGVGELFIRRKDGQQSRVDEVSSALGGFDDSADVPF